MPRKKQVKYIKMTTITERYNLHCLPFIASQVFNLSQNWIFRVIFDTPWCASTIFEVQSVGCCWLPDTRCLRTQQIQSLIITTILVTNSVTGHYNTCYMFNPSDIQNEVHITKLTALRRYLRAMMGTTGLEDYRSDP
jgi:hypothetical protein